MAFAPSLFCLSRGLKLRLRMFDKKYRFFMQNTGFGVSEYSFEIPEVGASLNMVGTCVIQTSGFKWVPGMYASFLKGQGHQGIFSLV